MDDLSLSPDYRAFVEDLKIQIRAAQVQASLAANQELILLYWRIGKEILHRQATLGWGSKVVEHLSRDLGRAFPEMKGFSRRNLLFMRSLAEAYDDEGLVKQLVSPFPLLDLRHQRNGAV